MPEALKTVPLPEPRYPHPSGKFSRSPDQTTPYPVRDRRAGDGFVLVEVLPRVVAVTILRGPGSRPSYIRTFPRTPIPARRPLARPLDPIQVEQAEAAVFDLLYGSDDAEGKSTEQVAALAVRAALLGAELYAEDEIPTTDWLDASA